MIFSALARTNFMKTLAACVIFACVALQSAHAGGFRNFLGMEFVDIPGGSFAMGSDPLEVAPFQIMPTEVTLAQYKRYIIESARIHVLTDEFITENSHDENAPVVFVSWTDARYFLHWLNRNKPGDDPGIYSLPTEVEWEYACRNGRDEIYCGGDKANAVGWNSSQNVVYQQPVAQKKANGFGLFDMSGNVHEWVMDCYHPGSDSTPTNDTGWGRGCHPSKRIVRGGSWKDGPESSRATTRLEVNINSHSPAIGFRVVRRLP